MHGRRLVATMSAVVAVPLLAAAGFALAGSTAGSQKSYRLKANLAPGQERPPVKNAPGANGVFTATLTLSAGKGALAWKLTFAHLTGAAVAAHVHLGAAGKPGPVAIPLCGPCRSGAHGVFSGALSGNSALVKALLHGGAYANVHTQKHKNGEIRGQIRVTGTTTTAGTTSSTSKGGWG